MGGTNEPGRRRLGLIGDLTMPALMGISTGIAFGLSFGGELLGSSLIMCCVVAWIINNGGVQE